MGISYSAVKTKVPEAWQIGKDYYRLTDLFPPCRMKLQDEPGLMGAFMKTLPAQYIVGPTPFVVTDLYPTQDGFIAKVNSLLARPLRSGEEEHLRDFYNWAGSDSLGLISDFDELGQYGGADENDDEYHLCTSYRNYRHMDEWGGDADRPVGNNEEESDEA